MKAVIQRVRSATLKVENKLISQIGSGLIVFLGVGIGDCDDDVEKLSSKISKLRIFEDKLGKMNLSIKDVGGEILLVSQFTLLADCKHGNRPSFTNAEKPELANNLYVKMCKNLESMQINVKTGVFGADMKIDVLNDGPVTIILDSKDLK